MDAGLGVRVALHADGLARTFARAGVGLGALTAHGQPAQVADAAVALDTLKALQVHTDFAAQIAFDHVFAFLNGMNDLRKLLLVQGFRPQARIDAGAVQDDLRIDRADAVNVTESDIDSLLAWDINT